MIPKNQTNFSFETKDIARHNTHLHVNSTVGIVVQGKYSSLGRFHELLGGTKIHGWHDEYSQINSEGLKKMEIYQVL